MYGSWWLHIRSERERERLQKLSPPLPNEISSQPDHMRAGAMETRLIIVISPQRQPISHISGQVLNEEEEQGE